MTSWVCLDANLVLKLYLNEELSDLADRLWAEHQRQGYRVVAPPLFRYEVTAVLRKNVYRGAIDQKEGGEALRELLGLSIAYPTPTDLHLRAYELATRLNLPTAYDAHYLVVAQEVGCEFWTADRRLVNAVSGSFSWVRWLGDYSPPESGTTA